MKGRAAKNRDKAKKRFAEAQDLLIDLQRIERKPGLADTEAEFRARLVAFIAMARSCVSMVGLNETKIDDIINVYPPDDAKLFRDFRTVRNKSLKEGKSILKTTVVKMPHAEYTRRHPVPPDPLNPRQPVISWGAAPPTHAVNVYELVIGGATRPAVETCRNWLGLVERFLQDAKVLG